MSSLIAEGEQSAILAFYAGAQNAHVGQIWRPREKSFDENGQMVVQLFKSSS